MIESIATAGQGLAAIIVLLGACIFFHEAGHFVLAKFAGMLVHEFALGFGPNLMSWRVGETLYSVRLVPLGGYVKIAGMDFEDREVERGFHSFPRWQGFTVLIAGSIMNVVLAALAFAAIARASGLPVFPDYLVRVAKVLPGTAAELAGLKAGDEIVGVNGVRHSLFIEDVTPGGAAARAGLAANDLIYQAQGQEIAVPPELLSALRERAGESIAIMALNYDQKGNISDSSSVQIDVPGDLGQTAAASEAAPFLEEVLGIDLAPLDRTAAVRYISERPQQNITLTVSREGRDLQVAVVPQAEWARVPAEDERGRLMSAHKKVGRIGVVLTGRQEKADLSRAILYGVERSVGAVGMVVGGLGAMFRGEAALEASGPVGIAAMTAESAKIGWTAVARLIGIISANLAVINLFPIPPFDGFRIALLTIEGIIGKRIDAKKEMAVTIAGVAVLLGLFLVITFKDIFNLVFYNTP